MVIYTMDSGTITKSGETEEWTTLMEPYIMDNGKRVLDKETESIRI